MTITPCRYRPSAVAETITGILNGSVFEKLNIERFVEEEFSHWVAAPAYFKPLRVIFHGLNRKLSQYDFSEVREDILKGVYQKFDLETRQFIG